MIERHEDSPGPSPTDQAANAAFDAIDSALRDQGYDADRAWAVVMVLIPDGLPTNSTVAGHMPGEPDPLAMLKHAVTQLRMIAAECGYHIDLTPAAN